MASSRITVRGGKVSVQITCAASRTACAGTLTLRSAAKVRVGGRSKLATLAPAARYTVAAGKRRTIVLKLGRDGRTLMKARRSLRARVALKPGRGAAVTRVVTLRR